MQEWAEKAEQRYKEKQAGVEHSEVYDPHWKSEDQIKAEEQALIGAQAYDAELRKQRGLADPEADKKLDSVLEAYDQAQQQLEVEDPDEADDMPELEQPNEEQLELERLQKTKEQKQKEWLAQVVRDSEQKPDE